MSWKILALTAALALGPLEVLAPTQAPTPPPVRGVSPQIQFITNDLPWAVPGKDYSPPPLKVQISGACPLGGIGFAVMGGALPPGIQLSRLGYFSGKPMHTGWFQFAVRASDGCSSIDREFAIVVTGQPVLTAAPTRLEFQWLSEQVPAPEQLLRISATWPDLPYQVTTAAGWLKVTPEHGVTPRQGSAMDADVAHVRVDGSHLAPGRYFAILTVSAWQALSSPEITVVLTVNGN